jgi:hypothetical protein
MHFNALVDEFTKIRPVSEIPGAPVDLVDHDAARFPEAELPEHGRPNRPSSFCGSLPFFEPGTNRKFESLGVALDCVPLFGQGNAALSLPCGRDTDIAKIFVQIV